MSPFCKKDMSDTGRVTEALEKAIRTGKMKAGERLDSVRNLAVRFGVGMTAVMRALDRLEKKQLIVRHPRSGVYAAELVPASKKKILLLSDFGNLAKVAAPGSYFTPCFESVCRERNWSIDTIELSFFSSISVTQITESLKRKEYDGVVSLGSFYVGNEPSLAVLEKLHLPTVFAAAQPGDSEITGFPSLVYSPEATWEKALDFLAEKGFHSIGAIGDRNGTSDRVSLRVSQGQHIESMRKHGFRIPLHPLCYFDYTRPEDAKKILSTFLDEYRRFDAVLCYSDLHAAFVYDHCKVHHIRIPEDLAVMGIGCYTGWDLLIPHLTTLDFHYEKTAVRTAEWLENPPPPRTSELWQSEVIPGDSTIHKKESTSGIPARKGTGNHVL